MRILYLHPKAWTGEVPLLLRLAALGHQLAVLEEWRDMPGAPLRFADHFGEAGDGLATLWYDPRRGAVKLLTWPIDRFFKRSFEGRNLAHRMALIRRAVRHFQPDVLLCAEGFAYAIPAALLRRLGMLRVPVVASYIGGDILDVPEADVGKRRTPLTRWLIRQGLHGVDRMRPFSPLLEAALLAEGADPRRIEIIPGHMVADAGALESVRRRKTELRVRVRERYAIGPDSPLVVTLGGNQKGKGLHLLAEAWPEVLRAQPRARWLLCGPPSAWLDAQVWPRLERAGCRDSVIAAGKLDGIDVFEHLAAADLHLTPTLADGGPMVNVEAAAVATPSLTTDMAGNAHWLKQYDCGRVVRAGDPVALGGSVAALLADGTERERLSANCGAMNALFSLEQVAARLSALLERAAGR